MNIKEENINLYTDEFLLSSQERLKEKKKKKLTGMGFDSFNCILTTNAEEGYIKIVYPELGLCFFKEYYTFDSPFSEHRIESSFEEDIDNIRKFNDTLNLRTIKEN